MSGLQAGRARIEGLDSLRGVAALCVLFLHFPMQSALINNRFFHESWLFVDFFFVLSGFVIAESYSERLTSGAAIKRFMWLRFWRLYPVHVTVLAIVVAYRLSLAAWTSSSLGIADAMDLGATALLLHAVGLPVHGWNAPSWSISVEFWMYLVAALVFFLVRRRRSVVAMCIAVGSLLILASTGDANLLRINEWALVRGLYGFWLGVIAFELRHAIRAPGRVAATVMELLAVGGTVAFVASAGKGPLTLAAPVIFFADVLLFSFQRGWISDLLQRRVPRFLGAISYPLYIVHFFLMFRLLTLAEFLDRRVGATLTDQKMFSGTLQGWLGAIATFTIIVAAAYALHVFVEDPLRRWSRRVVRPSSQA